MKHQARSTREPGFTLVELLCVIAIIGILAGLLLGPVARIMGKARALQWSQYSEAQLSSLEERLHKHLAGQRDFARLTLETLENNQWISAEQGRFLRDRRVSFTPFAGSDSDDLIIVAVTQPSGFLTDAGIRSLRKGALTKALE